MIAKLLPPPEDEEFSIPYDPDGFMDDPDATKGFDEDAGLLATGEFDGDDDEDSEDEDEEND